MLDCNLIHCLFKSLHLSINLFDWQLLSMILEIRGDLLNLSHHLSYNLYWLPFSLINCFLINSKSHQVSGTFLVNLEIPFSSWLRFKDIAWHPLRCSSLKPFLLYLFISFPLSLLSGILVPFFLLSFSFLASLLVDLPRPLEVLAFDCFHPSFFYEIRLSYLNNIKYNKIYLIGK